MALVKCRDCGSDVSKDADKCPKCGAPVESPKAKLLWLIGCAVVLLAVAIFCLVTDTPMPFPLNILCK